MTIYTRRGDDFKTDLIGGVRVYKDELRVEAYGTIDELSAVLGLARVEITDQETNNTIYRLQQKLQTIATIVADVKGKMNMALDGESVAGLEDEIDHYSRLAPQTQSFVISGDCLSAAHLHHARTVARRAERSLIRLNRQEEIDPYVIIYLNRLSDLLFVLSQWEQFRHKIKDLVIFGLKNYLSKNDQSELKEVLSMSLDLKRAKTILERAEKKALELNVPMTFAIVDEGGNILALHRMDGALLASLDIAQGKAYTALSLRMSTAELSKLVKPGEPLYGIENTNQGQIVIFGGGMPIKENGRVIGGLGVSGGSVEEDIEVATFALEGY